MPELPEVETVCRGLRPALVGKRLFRVEQRRPDLRFPFPEGFVSRLEGARVAAVERRAKYILIRLEDGWTWLVHLGMSGRFTVTLGAIASSGQAGHNSGWAMVEKHDHVLVDVEDGGRLVFNDTRRFGFMDLIPPGGEEESPHLAHLGPEPLSDRFSVAHFSAAIAGKRTPIKAALLDQRLVAGLGNIYVCEALWRAGISPRRSAHTVAGARAARLVPAVKDVLAAAIEAGGSSLRDYVQATGELGYFQHSWDAYDREGQVCRRPECAGVIARIVQSGRSSFYCPRHQR
ncbi:MAG: bifunctional DNA-formamidopyrimidine glycosylase/DNA-(apurinic or apyrimidinic site) lyase [Alphaproteobacteria bacterium]|nr:bifunctional DNA-formamidopyrimidine glycosylase/DNA-(apurinic or apyrimidinic site) lyase [Alphaproteobacteria bacterium]